MNIVINYTGAQQIETGFERFWLIFKHREASKLLFVT
jgi:hypothetical protein